RDAAARGRELDLGEERAAGVEVEARQRAELRRDEQVAVERGAEVGAVVHGEAREGIRAGPRLDRVDDADGLERAHAGRPTVVADVEELVELVERAVADVEEVDAAGG